jgi:hypothetical protein
MIFNFYFVAVVAHNWAALILVESVFNVVVTITAHAGSASCSQVPQCSAAFGYFVPNQRKDKLLVAAGHRLSIVGTR